MPNRDSTPKRTGSSKASEAPGVEGAVVGRATSDGPRTRGGWTPVGTAADRRAAHEERSTERGQRTRRLIIDAARRVFERDGYLDVGIDQIVKEAGVARGSYYTYFSTKLDVYRVVMSEVVAAIDAALVTRPDDARLDPVDALQRSNLRYMSAYRENAAIYALGEQLHHIDEEFRLRQIDRRRRDLDRIARTIQRWQERGVADPAVAPVPTAAALLSMSRHLCYWLYVGGDEQYDEADAAMALNDLWVRAVDLRRRPNRRWLEA